MLRVASIGECLVELNGTPFGQVHQTYGGDTLNTALYLVRLAHPRVDVQYVTSVGTDALSEGMVQRWQAEGIDTSLVLRDAAHLPGLYWIEVDPSGERRFTYWRGDSAARLLLQHPDFERVMTRMAEEVDLIYLSGVSLAILPERDRTAFIKLLTHHAAHGVTIAFDTNYRSALWTSKGAARKAMSALLSIAHVLFTTFDDERDLWGDEMPQITFARLRAANARSIVVKLGAAGCLYSEREGVTAVTTSPVANVVDSTSAGDAFNAGFLAAWLTQHNVATCCRVGNALAGTVIQYRGAIIPADATPSFGYLLAHNTCDSVPL